MTIDEKIEGREILERVFNQIDVNPNDSTKVRVASFCAAGDITNVIKKYNSELYKPLTITTHGN